MKMINTLIAVALLGAASAPALAHEHTNDVFNIRTDLQFAQNRLAAIGCTQQNDAMCAAVSSIRMAGVTLSAIPESAGDVELYNDLTIAADILMPATNERALKGQFEGLDAAQSEQASKILTDVMHQSGNLLGLIADLESKKGKN